MTVTMHRGLAVLVALLVLAQAALAGRFLFVDHDAVNIHQIIANILPLLVFADVALVLRSRTEWSKQTIFMTPSLAILVIAQIGLGYAGRDSANAAAIHVPLGVLIFGMAVVVASAAFTDRSTGQQKETQTSV